MSSVSEYRAAHRKLDEAIAELQSVAVNFNNDRNSWRLRDLLRAAREYARALRRVETMRSR